MMRSSTLIVAMCALLNACTPALDITRAPVTAAQRTAIPAERVAGMSTTTIRAYQEDASGKTQEIRNAVCTLRSRELQATVSTPQQVTYPLFLQAERFADRGQPGALTVNCRAGNISGEALVQAVPTNVSPIITTTATTTTSTGQTISTSTAPIFVKHLATSFPWHFGTEIRLVMKAPGSE